MSDHRSIRVLDFEPRFATALPETYALLRTANLTVHERVSRVILHGSRGLANCYRADSDIELDLALIFDTQQCRLQCFDRNTWSADL